ncbi:hypothetical protein AN639_04925 [Candidatus Epulonipiscium fishelsonii]|uniref:Uncharacterized protein n=1 Tax=Candidatus Epulonipiscium fishelsonii TaxID=77094 RepID=A0ACC8XDK6_9FIRM|nr:hypothetical protein AN639_04925 [Epulopiscium sp. SCG-B05WGA-EpuloA1]ONI40823.1 hypothetical protein AN396_05230 [Epulopiscium sp. SCG-B11WGA-EpuloA1]
MWMTRTAMNRPVSVTLSVVMMFVFGLSSLTGFRMSYMPSLVLPMFVVSTVYVGATADVIEDEITEPIADIGKNMSGFLQSITTSEENVSFVRLDFDYSTDMGQCYIDLKAEIDRLDLPEDAEEPIILEVSADSPIMEISVRSATGENEISFVEDILEPKISTVLGVGDVTIFGGTSQYVEILLNEPAMNQYGVSSFIIANAVQNANYTLPLGEIEQGNQSFQILASSVPTGLYDLMHVPITLPNGNTILLQDVASVEFVPTKTETISRVNGVENIGLSIEATQDANVPQVTGQIQDIIHELSIVYPNVQMEVVSNTSDGIYESLQSVASTLIMGVGMCMFVLYMFLGDLKASLIVGSSIPTSLLITIIGMGMLEFDLNLITTGALVISIGLMVDNAIVILESIFKCKTEDKSFYDAAIEGVKVVGVSVVASTITTIVVYVPLTMLSGLSGELFTSLGFTIIFALVASFGVAVTIIPLVYFKLQPIEKNTAPLNKIMHFLERVYEKIIRRVLNRKILVVLISLASLGGAGYIVSMLTIEMIPYVDQGIMDVKMEFRAGTDINFVNQAIYDIEQQIQNDIRIEDYSINIDGNTAKLTAYVADGYETKPITEEYDLIFYSIPNMDSSITTRDVSGAGTDMPKASISVYGVDYDMVKSEANRLHDAMYKIAGVSKVTSTLRTGGTQAKLDIDPLKAAFYGLQVSDISQIVYSMNNGIDVGTLEVQGEEYDITINYPEGAYDDFNKLLSLAINTSKGKITLGDVATIVFEDVEQSIQRVDGAYNIDLKAFTQEQYLPYVEAEVQKLRDSIPKDGIVEVTEQLVKDPLDGEMQTIVGAVITAVFLVFVVMSMQFESIRFAIMVMTSVVFSAIGAFGLLAISGQDLTLVALVGLLMLAGIVVNNGILFVDTVNNLKQEMSLQDALVKSGSMRMRPILMTTATTILSMVPLALGIGEGSQMLQGMGIIIIGGLLTSTILVLLLMPTFYLIISKK